MTECKCYRCIGIVPDLYPMVERACENIGLELSTTDLSEFEDSLFGLDTYEEIEKEAEKLKKQLDNMPSVDALAKGFLAILKEWLTEDQWEEFTNGENEQEGICKAHDYCDANMAMVGAFAKLQGIEEDDVFLFPYKTWQLMENAWERAKELKHDRNNQKHY